MKGWASRMCGMGGLWLEVGLQGWGDVVQHACMARPSSLPASGRHAPFLSEATTMRPSLSRMSPRSVASASTAMISLDTAMSKPVARVWPRSSLPAPTVTPRRNLQGGGGGWGGTGAGRRQGVLNTDLCIPCPLVEALLADWLAGVGP